MLNNALWHLTMSDGNAISLGEQRRITSAVQQQRAKREEEEEAAAIRSSNNSNMMRLRQQHQQQSYVSSSHPHEKLRRDSASLMEEYYESQAQMRKKRRMQYASQANPGGCVVWAVLAVIVIVCISPFVLLPMLTALQRKQFEAITIPPIDRYPLNPNAVEVFSPPVNDDHVSSAAPPSTADDHHMMNEPSRMHKGGMNNQRPSVPVFGDCFAPAEYDALDAQNVAAVVAIRGLPVAALASSPPPSSPSPASSPTGGSAVELPMMLTLSLALAPKHLPLQVVFVLSAAATNALGGQIDVIDDKRRKVRFDSVLRKLLLSLAKTGKTVHSSLSSIDKYTVLFSSSASLSSSSSSSSQSVESLSQMYHRGLDVISPSAGTVLFLSDAAAPLDPATFVFNLVTEFDALRVQNKKNGRRPAASASSVAALQCSTVKHRLVKFDTSGGMAAFREHLTNLTLSHRRGPIRSTVAKGRADLAAAAAATAALKRERGRRQRELYTDLGVQLVDSGWKIGVGIPAGYESDSLRGISFFGTWHGFSLRAAGFHPPLSNDATEPHEGGDGDDDEGEHEDEFDRMPFLVDAIGSNCMIVDRMALHEAGAFSSTASFPSDVDRIAAGAGWVAAPAHLAELFVFDIVNVFLDLVNVFVDMKGSHSTVSKRRTLRACITASVEAVTALEEATGASASSLHMRWGNQRPWRRHYSAAVREVLRGCASCPHQRGEALCPVVDEALCYCEVMKSAASNLRAMRVGESETASSVPDAVLGWSLSLRLRALSLSEPDASSASGGSSSHPNNDGKVKKERACSREELFFPSASSSCPALQQLRVASSRSALTFFVFPTSESVSQLLLDTAWDAIFTKHLLPPSMPLLSVMKGRVFPEIWTQFARSLFPEYSRVLAAHKHQTSWDAAPAMAWAHRNTMLAMWGRGGAAAWDDESNDTVRLEKWKREREQHQQQQQQQQLLQPKSSYEQLRQQEAESMSKAVAATITNDSAAAVVSWAPGDLEKMPFIHVIWFAICCGCCGFSSEIAHFTRPLSELYPVSLLLGPDCFCPGYESGFADVLGRAHLRPHKYPRVDYFPGEVRVWIAHSDPLSYRNNEYFHRRTPNFVIGRSMFEFTRVPASWEKPLLRPDMANEIWPPSRFVMQAFLDAGVPMHRMRLVPEGVDTNFFAPHVHRPLRLGRFDDVTSPEFHSRESITWSNYVCNRPPRASPLTASTAFPSPTTSFVGKRGRHQQQPDDEFIFFSQFKWEPRKGWRALYEAYFRTFYNEETGVADDGVTLLVLTMNFYMETTSKVDDIHNASIPFKDIEKLVSEMYGPSAISSASSSPHSSSSSARRRNRGASQQQQQAQEKKPPSLSDLPRFCILADQVSEREMARLFRGADAFVLPTRGEGWGLPTMQAMSMALPVISTNWGGSVDFTTPETTFLIELDRLEEVPRDSPYGWRPGMKWATPSVSHLRKLMRYVYEEPEHAKEVGRRAREHIVKNFDDFVVVRQVDRMLREIAHLSHSSSFWG